MHISIPLAVLILFALTAPALSAPVSFGGGTAHLERRLSRRGLGSLFGELMEKVGLTAAKDGEKVVATGATKAAASTVEKEGATSLESGVLKDTPKAPPKVVKTTVTKVPASSTTTEELEDGTTRTTVSHGTSEGGGTGEGKTATGEGKTATGDGKTTPAVDKDGKPVKLDKDGKPIKPGMSTTKKVAIAGAVGVGGLFIADKMGIIGGSATAAANASSYQIDPNTGFYIDPVSGYEIDPSTDLYVDPTTGYYIDPNTKDFLDPSTYQEIDPTSGQYTGLYYDPTTGGTTSTPPAGASTGATTTGTGTTDATTTGTGTTDAGTTGASTTGATTGGAGAGTTGATQKRSSSGMGARD